MKIGSIVAVKPFTVNPAHVPFIKWEPVKDEKTPYMIRDIGTGEDGSPVAVFEEGIIGYFSDGKELGIYLRVLIELLPPEDISKQVDEMMPVPIPNTMNNTLQRMRLSLKNFIKR